MSTKQLKYSYQLWFLQFPELPMNINIYLIIIDIGQNDYLGVPLYVQLKSASHTYSTMCKESTTILGSTEMLRVKFCEKLLLFRSFFS